MIEIYYYDKGIVKIAKISELAKIKKKKVWIDITNLTKVEADLLRKTFDIHPLSLDDLIKPTRVKVELFHKYMFCVFYVLKKNRQMIELDLVLGKNFIISNHRGEIKSFEALQKDKVRMAKLFEKGVDFIFHEIVDGEIINYMPILEETELELEEIENDIIKKVKPIQMSKILEMKKELSQIKRTAMNMREKFSFLTKNEYPFVSRNSLPYFRDIYDHTIRISEKVDVCRESVSNAYDVYMSTLSNNMNQVMKMLSIIATIALPLTAISSIYGTNFRNLPGSQLYIGFWIMIATMLSICIVMLIYFRTREWI